MGARREQAVAMISDMIAITMIMGHDCHSGDENPSRPLTAQR
jgi:hypothetical protein